MATPTLTRHQIDGVLGPIFVDVRAGGRDAARPAVVLLHGFKGFKDWGMFPPLAERLARAGVTVVSGNVSGSGVDATGAFAFPGRFARNRFSDELQDITLLLAATAAGAFETVPPTSIGLLGHSRGGGLAILAAAGDARVKALVTWAAISTVERWTPAECRAWRAAGHLDVRNARTGEVVPLDVSVLDDLEAHATGTLDIAAAAARVTVPWLLAHGTADAAVPLDEARALQAAQPAAEPCHLEGAGHTFGAVHPWAGSTPALDRIMEKTIQWFGRHLT